MSSVTGIILAGGKSRRMGQDKSFISIGGKSLIEIVMDKMLSVFEEVVIITNNASKYEKYIAKVDVRTDVIPECGPLGGIYTGLISTQSSFNFVVACDMPFLNINLLSAMIKKIDSDDAIVVEYGDRIHPLCALYHRNCSEIIKKQIDKGNFKMRDFLKCIKVKKLNETEVKEFDPNGMSLVNINTYDEYLKYKDYV